MRPAIMEPPLSGVVRLYNPLSYVDFAVIDRLLGITSFVSLLSFGFVLRTFHVYELMRGQLGVLLLAFASTFALFNVMCFAVWFYPWPIVKDTCRYATWVELFSLHASPAYFCMLAWYLRDLAGNPFADRGKIWMHFVALMWAGFLAWYEHKEVEDELFDALHSTEPCILEPRGDRCVACPHVFMFSWMLYWSARFWFSVGVILVAFSFADLRFALGPQGNVFSERKKLVLKGFLCFMLGNALYQLLMPTVIIFFKDVLGNGRLCVIAECVLQGLATTVAAAAMLILTRIYRKRLERFSTEDKRELANALRVQVVNVIKNGAIQSAEKHQSEALPTPADFTSKYKMTFGSNARVTALAPRVFHHIRGKFDITEDDFVASMKEDVRENLTEGKSGAFMYFTADRRFMIKTATQEEFGVLFKILDKYTQFVEENPATLINPMVGAFELNIFDQHLKVIILQSVFWLGDGMQANFIPNERFDLKGSWVGRHTEVPKQIGLPFLSPSYVKECRKDKDIHAPLRLNPLEMAKVSAQLEKDSDFLARCKIMDYSLLLGVKRASLKSKAPQSTASASSTSSKGLRCGRSWNISSSLMCSAKAQVSRAFRRRLTRHASRKTSPGVCSRASSPRRTRMVSRVLCLMVPVVRT